MPRRAAAPRELLVRVLGSVCVERDGERLALPPSKKTRALLGYLLVEGREQTREHLCSLFWDLPDDPRGALRWSLSRLRPLLDDPGCGRVVADRERVRIDLAGARLDLKMAQSLRMAEAGVGELRAAAELFRGDLLEGLELCDAYRFQAWCTARREEARQLHAQVLNALVARLGAQPEEALAPARKLVELLPADEGTHRTVMELLGRLGRQKDVVAQYDALREILRATSGGRPSAGIEHLRRSLGAESPPAPPARVPPPAPRSAPLIGRREELARIARARGTVLLLGEPGIGKTRMLEEIARGAGGLVLSGRSYEAEQAHPYGCIIEALRASGVAAEAGEVLRRDLGALLSELTPAPEGLDRARLFDAVAALLRDRAATLLLDDVQWIDEASAALSHYLARTAGVRLVVAAREGELWDNAAALRLRRALRREGGLEEVRLRPLAAADTAALMRSRGISGDPAAVHSQSAGNPLWTLELGRALGEGRPALSGGLLEMLEQGLDALDAPSQALLAWAAALGSTAQPSLLARVTARPEAEIVEAFSRLERRGLTRTWGEGWDFAHDLIREAALRRIPAARRKLLHAALARALWESPQASRLAGTVARQALLGGEDELAVRASVEASKQALGVFAAQEALALAQQASGLLPALRGEERLRAHLELLHVRVHADRRPDRLEGTVAELSRLVLDAEAAGASNVVAEGLQLISWAQYYREDEEGALRGSLRGAEVARSNPDPLVRARALAQAGRCLAQIEREPERTAQLLEDAAQAAQSARAVVLDVPLGRGLLAAFLGDDEGARRHLESAARLALEAGDFWRHSQAVFELCAIALDRREGEEAVRLAQAVLPVVEKMPEGDEPLVAKALLALARLLVSRGGDADADALFLQALEALRANEARWGLAQALILRGELELWLGRVAQAEAVVEQLRSLSATDDAIQMRQGRAQVLMAELALARADPAARRHLALALRAPGSIGGRLRARITAAGLRAGTDGKGAEHAEIRGRA